MTTHVNVEVLVPSKWWRKARYRLTKPVSICGYTAEAGFITDGATVPRLLALVGAFFVLLGVWVNLDPYVFVGVALLLGVVWFPPVGRYWKAAIIHDWLLLKYPDDRHKADRAFLVVMKKLGIARWRRLVMFLSVWLWSEIIMAYRKLAKRLS